MPPASKLPGQTIRQKAKAGKGGKGRDVVKPVLANPFTVAWPSLPNHLQAAVFAALPQIVPPDIAEYHVSRQRCTRALKRAKKEKAKETKGDSGNAEGGVVTGTDADAADGASKDHSTAQDLVPPARPQLLDQFVFGLNETIKAVEKGIAELRLCMALMADALEGKETTREVAESTLLPTEPVPAAPNTPLPPLAYILVPNLSVSPQSLIDPLPSYCATYNALLKQHATLAAEVTKRLPKPERFITHTGEAITLVPLGKREAELSALVGLRRVSTLAIRNTHPSLGLLAALLPNSVLPPPRLSVTLPFPTTSLTIHDAPVAKVAPAINYPPLHVKAIHTTAPTDGNARKAARIAEVRRKRVENKEKRAAARAALERAALADIKKTSGRATRLAAKAAMDVSA